MKKYYSLLLLLFTSLLITQAQDNVGIGTTTPHNSAVLDITANSKGLLIPRVTFSNRPANPATGLLIYQTDNTPGFYYFNGTSWAMLTAGGLNGSGNSNQLAYFSGSNSINSIGNLATNTTAGRLEVNSNNNGSGTTHWIALTAGAQAGDKVVQGLLNGEATIGAHNNLLNAWAPLIINPAGNVKMPSIAGSSSQMVVVAADGTLSSTTLPANDNLGNHTATQNLNLANNKLVGNNGTNGITIANDGTTTINNLAGSGNRMVIADNNGTLSTQTIPVADNLGNHTASQNLNLNNNWISNNGTANGIKVDNDGNVGINLNAPQGIFDVPNYQTVYAGMYSTVSALSYAFASSEAYLGEMARAFDNNNNTHWMSTTLTPAFLGQDFGAGNEKVIRNVFMILNGVGSSTNVFTYFNVIIQGSNNGTTYVDLHQQTYWTVGTGTFVANAVFDNRVAYRYYRAYFVAAYEEVNNNITNIRPRICEINFNTQASSQQPVSGAFTVKTNGNVGIGTNNPTANLDITGSLRIRQNAASGAILTSDANGNASWSNSLSPTNISGAGGLSVSTTNPGSGIADWIAINNGGSAGDRVVMGNLLGKATIGAHNNALNDWSDLVINNNPAAGSTVTIGGNANQSPSSTNQTTALNTKLIVNGSIRQGFYSVPISIPANNVTYVTWNHNLGYGPIVMMSTDQNGGGGYMDYCIVTTFNNNLNQTVFVIRNMGSNAASGTLRWVLVW